MKRYNGSEIFRNRCVVIATMHKKETVIEPLLKQEFGLKAITPKNFDTDQFGTFSGEIERVRNPLETVRAKALAALLQTNENLAIASEGSFGPHPESPFIIGNEELVILIDTKNGFEIIGRHFTEKTNFNHQKIENLNDLKEFSERIGFPEHGIILKISNEKNSESIYKDFKSFDLLHNQVVKLLDEEKKVQAETDMRAFQNPTRMEAIKQATKNLVNIINTNCPKCNAPGYSIIEAIRGLRCELCNLPTKGLKGYIFSCQKCNFSCERKKEDVNFQNATFCDYCNP
ncbi:DUF6671 family protein [Aequorivita sp. CIP111184]|uniref:DUF6671 family protein n=1 Tax=Aequorivita sp. CIP111184 TaxID=2211356 RepID=UPI000DBBDBDC|nr:DUF6671 family protein [Aequorivita sp. CIP111184]SRX56143.1 hypothetical protein AEQU1_03170 [Aequorivita sp. CIP111184]